PQALWTEVVTTGGQFALYAPGLPGDWCQHINLRLSLDPEAPLGTPLDNHVVVTTPDDAQPENNERLNQDATVSGERYDLTLSKSMHAGVPVPGGGINYFIWYANQGNTASRVWVTETVPAGLTYEYAHWGGGQPGENEPLPDPAMVGNALVWDLGELGVNESRWFHVQMAISDTLEAGDQVANCAVIGTDGEDGAPENNESCYSVTLNPNGPNLNVSKEHWWNGDGQLGYRVVFYNLGDETVSDVWVTDTLPVDTAWDGWWNLNDLPYDRLVETTENSDLLAWHFSELYPGERGILEFNANLDEVVIGEPLRWYTNTVEITPLTDDVDPADNEYSDVAFSGGEVRRAEMWLGTEHADMWGEGVPGTVTITTPYTQVTVWGDPGCNGCWNTGDTGDIGPIWPGDTIVVEAGEGVQPVTIVVPDPFSAEADSTTDQVWGQIDSVANEQVRVEDYWNGGYQEVWTNAAGEYVATYADIPRGAEGHVRYLTMRDYADVMFHRRFAAQDLLVRVDYSEDGVDGNYEPGHTGWITVTDSIGSIKATVEITTETWPWWGGSSGFSTHHHEWYPEQPDVVPGDWVYATLDNNDSTNVQVGTIDATLDVAYDLITGTLDVSWYSEDLFVRCEIHENNAPGIDVGYIAPVGEEFVCDFRGRWDITPGQQVVVVYVEPDGDQVQYRPANPAPYLRVQKGLDGNRVAEGGNAVFSVQYRNEGDAPAPDVVITETLQGMTYLTDTSGFAHTGSGNQVVWDLGTVDPGDWIWFNLFAEVTASVGERVTNTAEIATSDPFDQGDDWEKRAEWSDEVAGNDTYLNVGKWAWTGDPAPDGDVVFSVNTCSYGSTGSTEVTVTDTLPLSLTLQYWWAQHPGWYEVSSSDHQLVVARPSMPAGWCSEVYLRAKVDAAAWPGMPISNTATITAANDLSSDDNEAPWWGQVGNPHTNLSLNKNWGSGQLVPGGTLQYWVYIHNNGNQPVGAFTITETLPISTSLAWIWRQDQSGQYFVTPTHVGTNQLVWEVAEGLDSGYSANYEVGLMVDPDAVPGTVLVNTAEATCLSGEDTCDDNASSWTETLRDHGPNLRVRKEGQWDDGGENTRRAGYWLTVENVGDEAVHDVTVTDTYPTDMVLDGGVGGNFWQWWDWRDNGDHFTITLELLEPGWSPGFNFGLIANTEPLPFGLVFTNTAEVTLVGSDTNPDDNVDTVTLTTGPDLWVQKTLVGGDLLPGELVTFSLRFGNDHQGHEWWWNTQGSVWLTDTLPSGFEFITATRRSWGWAPYAPDRDDGTHVAWDTGGMPAGQEDELLVTLRIPPTATGLDTFSNEAEVASSEPVSDTEPFYTNNTSRATFAIDLPHFEVSKAYESNRVAGMPVTYTLDVVNTGNSTATSVVLTDTVPGGLTNVQTNGSAAAGLVTWNLGSLTAQGGTATGWFRGNLPCTVGTVTNVDYGVTSAEGPSATGVPVQLTVLAPALTAGFEASALSVVQGTTVDFTDASTTDGTGIVSWAWDFDDGDTSTDQNPTHTFDAVDTYQVKLTVTDGCGFTDDATLTIIVTSACTPLASADFTFAPEHPLINTAVAFNATTAPLNATGPITYSWTFGDGQTATVTTPAVQHTYASDGAKSVMLTAYNLCTPEGVTATDTVTVKLYEVYLPLVMRAP
ncbi:MAG: DUF11 domain-containing protein, partial [Anaerolineae bacterium]|nr:DUF11 domain-containing protein [Anaerolineae bacterium]